MALGSDGRRIVVEFIGDASSLKKGIGDGEKSLQGFSGKAQAVGSIAGKVLAGGLLLAGVAAVKAGQAAADDQAAQSQLAQQLKQAAGATDAQVASVESWITAQGKATGITDDELRPAIARLATATGSVTKAQKLAALAMDVSAGTGKSLQQVTEAMVKAQNGSIGGLGRLGVATKDAEGKTLSLTQVTQLMADKYNGAAAKAAETTAGKQKILTTQMGELQEQIGANLLPVMVKLSEVGLQVVGWISNNTKTAGILVGVLASLFAITTAVGLATKLAGTFTALWTAGTKIAAAAQWLLNAALDANPIGLVIIAIAALVAGLILAYKHSETFRKVVDAAFGAIKKVVTAVVTFVTNFVRDHWRLMIALVAGPMGIIIGLVVTHWARIKAVFQASVAVVKSVVSNGFAAIRAVFSAAAGVWHTIVGNAWDGIKAIFQRGKDAVVSVVGNLRDAATGAFNAIKGPIDSIANAIQSLINKLADLAYKLTHLPHPSLPHIPGLGRVGGAGGGVAGGAAGLVAGGKDALVGTTMGLLGRTGSGGAPTIHVHFGLVGDPVAAAREFEKAIRKLERATGRRLLAT